MDIKNRIIAEYSMRITAYRGPEYAAENRIDEFFEHKKEYLDTLEEKVSEFVDLTAEVSEAWATGKSNYKLLKQINVFFGDSNLFPKNHPELVSKTMLTLRKLIIFLSKTRNKKDEEQLREYWNTIDERYLEFLKEHPAYELAKKFAKNYSDIA